MKLVKMLWTEFRRSLHSESSIHGQATKLLKHLLTERNARRALNTVSVLGSVSKR
jgi:hypothetical protein